MQYSNQADADKRIKELEPLVREWLGLTVRKALVEGGWMDAGDPRLDSVAEAVCRDAEVGDSFDDWLNETIDWELAFCGNDEE